MLLLAPLRRIAGLGDRLHRAVAVLLRDLRMAVEQRQQGGESVSPDVLSARLAAQLGREPTRDELLLLLTVVEGLETTTSLLGPRGAGAVVASYATGLRRQVAG